MASPTRVSKRRRELRRISLGKTRKRNFRVSGSTQASLALDHPNANELAQAKSRS